MFDQVYKNSIMVRNIEFFHRNKGCYKAKIGPGVISLLEKDVFLGNTTKIFWFASYEAFNEQLHEKNSVFLNEAFGTSNHALDAIIEHIQKELKFKQEIVDAFLIQSSDEGKVKTVLTCKSFFDEETLKQAQEINEESRF